MAGRQLGRRAGHDACFVVLLAGYWTTRIKSGCARKCGQAPRGGARRRLFCATECYSEIVVVAPRESTAVSRCGLRHLVTPGVGQIETLRLVVFLKRENKQVNLPALGTGLRGIGIVTVFHIFLLGFVHDAVKTQRGWGFFVRDSAVSPVRWIFRPSPVKGETGLFCGNFWRPSHRQHVFAAQILVFVSVVLFGGGVYDDGLW